MYIYSDSGMILLLVMISLLGFGCSTDAVCENRGAIPGVPWTGMHELMLDALGSSEKELLIIEDIAQGGKYGFRILVWGFGDGRFIAFCNDEETLRFYSIPEKATREFRHLLRHLPASGLGNPDWIEEDRDTADATDDGHTIYVWGKDGGLITYGRITCPSSDDPMSSQELWIWHAEEAMKQAGIDFWKAPVVIQQKQK